MAEDLSSSESQAIVRRLHGLLPEVRRTRDQLEQQIMTSYQSISAAMASEQYWVQLFARDALRRCADFVELKCSWPADSISLLVSTRYLLELTIWRECMAKEPLYGLVYYFRALENRRDGLEAYKAQLFREIDQLRAIEQRTSPRIAEAMQAAIAAMKDGKPFDNARLAAEIDEVDAEAARSFLLYAANARTNGFSFQAHLVETQELPRIEAQLAEVRHELEEFRARFESRLGSLPHALRRWRWNEQAKYAGLESDYAFIYRLTSKVLHAEPESVSTSGFALAQEEQFLLLRYYEVRMRDALASTRELLRSTGSSQTT